MGGETWGSFTLTATISLPTLKTISLWPIKPETLPPSQGGPEYVSEVEVLIQGFEVNNPKDINKPVYTIMFTL